MSLDRVAVALVVVLTLVVPTAATSVGQDDVGPLELAPHPGPNGDYADVVGGDLEVDFGKLADSAVTKAHDVATITVSDDRTYDVWVTVDAGSGVSAYRGDDPSKPITEATPARLSAGESVALGFAIDSRADVAGSGTVTVHAERVRRKRSDPVDPAEDEEEMRVSVTDANGSAPEGATVEILDAVPDDGAFGDPRAVVEADRTVGIRGRDLVVDVTESVELSGRASVIGSTDGVDREQRTVGVAEISVPEEWQNRPSTVRFEVDRDRFGRTDPADARVARRIREGWQLLPTTVAAVTDETVVLTAETPGFSTFAVFADTDVRYEWTLPNGTVVEGEAVRTAFDDPGRYEVTLTLTDAMGRSDTARTRILANDRPSVVIEVQANATAAGPTTLRANVSNEVGNATVTWTMPDGSVRRGTTIDYTFEPGEHVVRATVEDEFGAVGRNETTVAVGGGSSGGLGGHLDVTTTQLPLNGQVGLAVVAALLAGLLVRVPLSIPVPDVRSAVRDLSDALVTSRAPQITAVENVTWNPEQGWIEIERLRVESPGSRLDTIEVAVTDGEGAVLVTKTIDAGDQPSYEAASERLWVPGGVAVAPGRTYRIAVRATDVRDNAGSRSQSYPTAGVRAAD